MAKSDVGYEFLREHLSTGAFPLSRVAKVAPVNRVVDAGSVLQVPSTVAPGQNENPLAHLLFALKHEGLEMQAAILALKKIPGKDVLDAYNESPSSAYLRTAGYLWELANQAQLQGTAAAQGAYSNLFDPAHFITSASVQKDARWRVNFNGLGDPYFCPTVKRSESLKSLMDKDILDQVQVFVAGMDKSLLERAVKWAYLSETEGSYNIERESPSANKKEAFAKLLSLAHKPEPITEEYLASLQQIAVSNPLDQAFEFRNQQNWLRGALPGALGITYIPPEPDVMLKIMSSVMHMANNANQTEVDPLVMAALTSFSFVFAHPFMDGNGRLSRFLFHRVACSSGALPDGIVLPVSVAMNRNEASYLSALESFSRPARDQWAVEWADSDRFKLEFKGEPEIYRYWDATPCVEFGLRMAQEALDKDLRTESEFLRLYDKVHRALNNAIDMNSNDLALLTRFALTNNGTLSNNRMKQFLNKGHPASLLKTALEVIAETLNSEASDEDGHEAVMTPGSQPAP